jgi:hypothetical protein
MSVNNPPMAAVGTLAVVIVIFLVLREVVCCYWKINRTVELLESIDATLYSRDRSRWPFQWCAKEGKKIIDPSGVSLNEGRRLIGQRESDLSWLQRARS